MTTTCAILAIGDELTTGQKIDSNSAWLSGRLLDRGIETVEHITVPDDAPAIGAALRRLAGRARVILITGGLGPTADDLTRDGLAIALGSAQAPEELIEDPDALAEIRNWFQSTGRRMPEPNRVQALRPRSARWLHNGYGTAPGLRAQIGETQVWALPGPPREMRPMFERFVEPELPAPDRAICARFLHCFGAGESRIAEMLGDLMNRDRNPLVGTTASGGIITCRLRAVFDEVDAAERALDQTERAVRDRLGSLIFGAADDTLESVVLDLLRARTQRLATVESCTGGGLGAALTDIAGASDVYLGGWVTYTNALKTAEVGVPEDLLERHGAVSREVASAMAVGGRTAAGADWSLAITGIAGPGGGAQDKPVGTVWIACAGPDDDSGAGSAAPDIRRFHFPGTRNDVRQWSIRSALGMLRLALTNNRAAPLLRQQDPPAE
ncbi:MAG: CinA family nicotinamide mononucleotide deamidase-related protein [Phycisphaerales bacterium JB039]